MARLRAWALKELDGEYDIYSILRVTSPFRADKHIQEAMKEFYYGNYKNQLISPRVGSVR